MKKVRAGLRGCQPVDLAMRMSWALARGASGGWTVTEPSCSGHRSEEGKETVAPEARRMRSAASGFGGGTTVWAQRAPHGRMQQAL